MSLREYAIQFAECFGFLGGDRIIVEVTVMLDIDIDEASKERLIGLGQDDGNGIGFDVFSEFVRDGGEYGEIVGI